MSSWWCGDPRVRRTRSSTPPPHDQIDRFGHVMFGGLTHAPAVRLAERLVDARARGPMAHVFLADSGSVSGRGRPQDGAAVPARRSAAPSAPGCSPCAAATTATRSAAMSVCDPVGGMHSLFPGVLPRQVFAAGRRRTPRGRDDGRGAWADRSASTLGGEVRPRATHADELAGDHRRAAAPGRRRHARLRPRLPAGAARGRRRARPAARRRRDRHRLRPHRRALRLGVGGRRPRRHVRRQGADRRLPHPRRGAHDARGRARPSRRRSPACCCTGRPSWATRSPAPSPMPRSTCSRRRLGGPRAARRRACSTEHLLRGGGTAPASPTCAPSAPSASCSSTTRSTSPRVDRRRAAAGRLGAPVPRPRLHDAALRLHRRRRPPASPTAVVGAVAEVHG